MRQPATDADPAEGHSCQIGQLMIRYAADDDIADMAIAMIH